jgi:hypothetical protein
MRSATIVASLREDAAVTPAQLDADVRQRRLRAGNDDTAFDDLCVDGRTDRE